MRSIVIVVVDDDGADSRIVVEGGWSMVVGGRWSMMVVVVGYECPKVVFDGANDDQRGWSYVGS